ncbi:unnamed protein product [Penicillium egyptiacum]|uniref:Uncharacterized protein n=9 Tax=Penicillium TaxID=5073 RepID=A0A9W4KCB8_9EURO|nr:unnamed protein product [Penicillium egyptiacum]
MAGNKSRSIKTILSSPDLKDNTERERRRCRCARDGNEGETDGPDLGVEQIFSSSPAPEGQLVIPGETTCSSLFVATSSPRVLYIFSYSLIFADMSETFQELADIPKDFVREGSQFVRRCTKPDKREFIKISQAVGMGFLVMGAIGYFVKLIHIPVNQVLVGGA